MASSTKRRRLNHEERELFRTKIRHDPSDRNLSSLVSEWNSRVAEHKCEINIGILRRMRDEMPKSPESIWEEIKSGVGAETSRPNAWEEYQPPVAGYDYEGCKVTPVDAFKIPFATEPQMASIKFDFDNPRYKMNGDVQEKKISNQAFKADFRKHFNRTGMVYGSFKNFISQDERDALGADCEPSTTNGPWKTLADVVTGDKKFRQEAKKSGTAFANFNTHQERINPNYDFLRNFYIVEKRGTAGTGVASALVYVLSVCEAVFRSVSSWLPTCDRKDSFSRKYAIPQDLIPSYFSLLSCLAIGTTAQIEHMDDHCPGASALWGLVPDQYVIVWLHSYEMNRELEELSSDFYEFVMKQPRPEEWTEEAFWNLVAGLWLKVKGFDSWRKPTPVKIPLKVGELLLMDFLIIHAGMPYVAGSASLRGHLYWAQIASREGEKASESTCFLWATYQRLYPSWRILSKDRQKFQ